MKKPDYEAFVVLLDSTAQLYGKNSPSHNVIALWWESLKNYDLPAIRQALTRHIQNPDTGQFMPKPADVVRMLGGTTQDSALQAWSKVDRAVRTIGPYQSVVFDDPIIHAVIADMGGWVTLANKSERDWPFVAREFENRYRAYRTAGHIASYPQVLIGIAQSQNEPLGLPVSEPVLIGDPEQAMQTRLFGCENKPVATQQIESPPTTLDHKNALRRVPHLNS